MERLSRWQGEPCRFPKEGRQRMYFSLLSSNGKTQIRLLGWESPAHPSVKHTGGEGRLQTESPRESESI